MHSAEGTVFDELDYPTMEHEHPLILSSDGTSSSVAATPPPSPPQKELSLCGKLGDIDPLMIAGSSSGTRHEDRSYGEIERLSPATARHPKPIKAGLSNRRRPMQRLGVRFLIPNCVPEMLTMGIES